MQVQSIDHVVLTVKDVDVTAEFYQRVLGMELISFGVNNERKALGFGQQKINLHALDHEYEPKAARPAGGSMDICLITKTPIVKVIAHLQSIGVFIEQGPVNRTGAAGPILSVYIRDPDQNLIEVSNQL